MEKSEFNPGNIRVSRILFGLGIICVLHLCQPARGEWSITDLVFRAGWKCKPSALHIKVNGWNSFFPHSQARMCAAHPTSHTHTHTHPNMSAWEVIKRWSHEKGVKFLVGWISAAFYINREVAVWFQTISDKMVAWWSCPKPRSIPPPTALLSFSFSFSLEFFPCRFRSHELSFTKYLLSTYKVFHMKWIECVYPMKDERTAKKYTICKGSRQKILRLAGSTG